jgi:CRP-like cAMP-binding protein
MTIALPRDKGHAALIPRRSPLFRTLSPAALAQLVAGSRMITAARGEQLFRCGEQCSGLYTVTRGRIALSVCMTGGASKVVDLIGPGAHAGLAATVLGASHTTAAQALTDTSILLTPHDTLFACAAEASELWPQIAAELSRQVSALIADVAAFSLNSGRERVARFLLDMGAARGSRHRAVTLPAKKSIIASRLNLTPEYFSRMLHELIADGTIAVNGRNITVLDPVRLRAAPQQVKPPASKPESIDCEPLKAAGRGR